MKMLIALDDSEYAIKVVNYVASTAKPTFFNITLFTVLPLISSSLEKEFALPHFAEKLVELKWLASEKKKMATEIMEKCRTILLDAGFPDDKIESKIQDKAMTFWCLGGEDSPLPLPLCLEACPIKLCRV
jgi:hypothetical protein